MRVLIVAVGSRGDVVPYTGLGDRLRRDGHQVTVAAQEPLGDLVRPAGLDYHPLPMDIRATLDSRAGRSLATGPAGRGIGTFVRLYAEHMRQMGDAMVEAAESADLILASTMGWLAYHVAQARGIPCVGAFLQPLDPTGDFPPPALTTRSLGRTGNRVAARTLRWLGQVPFLSTTNGLRRRLGLRPTTPGGLFRQMSTERMPVFYGYSPAVVPRPRDWPEGHEVAGYWWPYRDPGWVPPQGLVDFLDAGDPPVFVGFGSMTGGTRSDLLETVVAALRRAGVRGVVQAGWAGLGAGLPAGLHGDGIMTVGDLPHEWLFPRMAAVVHHAGAGTTAAGLRAGVPAVPVPTTMDSPFWAQRLVSCGTAPVAVPFRRLDVGSLAAAISSAVGDPALRERAAAMAARLAVEDGAAPVAAAVARLSGG